MSWTGVLRWKHIVRINIPKPPFIELRLGTQADPQVHSKWAFYEAGGLGTILGFSETWVLLG